MLEIAGCILFAGLSVYFFRKLFSPKKGNSQNTFIYCDNCGNELCSSNSIISDKIESDGQNHVRYKCSKCNQNSDYNFDIAPVPINWKDLLKDSN